MNVADLSVKSIFKKSFRELKQYFWFYVAISIIYGMINIILFSTSFLLLPIEMLKRGIITQITFQLPSATMFLYIFINIITYVLGYLVFIGLAYQIYLVKKSEFYNYRQLFQDISWNMIGRIFFGGILYSLGITLGLIAFIIPGIILALVWCLWPFIIFEGTFSVWDSLGQSYRRTKGHLLNILLLIIITYLLEFLIILPIWILATFLGIMSGLLFSKIFGRFFDGFAIHLWSINQQNINTIFLEQQSGILFLIPIIFLYFLSGMLGKIFTILVLAEIYNQTTIAYNAKESTENRPSLSSNND